MIARRIVLGALTMALLAGAYAQTNDKISPFVVAGTANGASTEALVVLSQQADLSPAYTLKTKLEKGNFVVNSLRTVASRTQAPILSMLQQRGVPYQSFFIVNMIKVTGDRNLMEALAARADVARIEANPLVHTGLPNPNGKQPSFQPQGIEWNVTKVKAPDVWALGFTGTGRVVSGADTGVQWDHPALKNHYRGWDGQQVNHDYNWHDAVQQTTSPNDPHGHGTFTVSEEVGDDGAGNQVGVAPGAKWIACRNMDSGGNGKPAWYSECFEFLIAPYPIGGGQGDPSKAPDAINNSWTCPPSEGCSTETLHAIVDAVRAAGIVPVFAASNYGPNCSTIQEPPAIYASAFDVGALDSNNNIASFSSRGPVIADGSHRTKPDVSAPGVNIRGAVPGNGYQSGWSGTSMAAPHVAGAVALLWQENPSLVGDVAKTEANLDHSATHLIDNQAVGNCRGPLVFQDNTFGYGLINLLKAVQQ